MLLEARQINGNVNELHMNDGNGVFTVETSGPISRQLGVVAIGDIDNDGDVRRGFRIMIGGEDGAAHLASSHACVSHAPLVSVLASRDSSMSSCQLASS